MEMVPTSRRRLMALGFATAGIAGSLVAACGGDAAPAAPAKAEPTKAAAPAAPAAPTAAATAAAPTKAPETTAAPVKFPETLAVTTINNFATNDPAFLKAADEFMAERKVKIEFIPGNNQEVITKIAGGTPPDVFRRDAAALHGLVAEGAMRDLNPFLAKTKDVQVSDFYPHLIKGQTYQGKLVALPEDFQPAPLLFYNTQIFEKAGEKPPTPDTTWADFLEQAKRLTKGSGDVADVYGYSFPKWTYEQFVYNHGGQTVDNVENPAKCLLDSTQAIQGLEFMVDLQHKHRVMPSPQVMTGANIPSENNWFLGGRLATLNGGTWFTGNLNTAKDNLPWAMTLAPRGQDGKAHYPTGGAGWAIPTASKNADAAWAWMSWQFGPAGWKSWIAKRDPKTFWLPALKSIAADEAKRLEQFYPNASLVVRSADSIWFRPGGAKWEKANAEILGPALTSLHENKAPVKTTIQEAVTRINAVLAGG